MTDIAVYADWEGLQGPKRVGMLNVRRAAGRDVFEFEYDREALQHPDLGQVQLDPRIGLFAGPQYPAQGHDTLGVFADACPDRWGRMLMRRRHEREQRASGIKTTGHLHESDFLLGVHDAFRIGALRFRLGDTGGFLDNRHDVAAPPFVRLRELEAASAALERDETNTAEAGDDWLRMLIAPGGSLGGARPKASVVDPEGQLWIAKFPSIRDDHDVGAWEAVVNALAHACGIQATEGRTQCFANPHHCFLVKRFDRTANNRRIHFASAMTLTGHQDGEDASTGVSYLEIANVLVRHGAQTERDLHELWSRIVFNMLVSNADDHLRNHGFLLVPGRGWRLSPAYDMNPVPDAHGLKLNVTEADNALDLDLARSVAHLFRINTTNSEEIIARHRSYVSQWRTLAQRLGISVAEQERMVSAFKLVN